MKKKILIIGSSSKIAQALIGATGDKYEIYATSRTATEILNAVHTHYVLDLSDRQAISTFLTEVKDIVFDAVLFFAATYSPDPEGQESYLDQLQSDLQINALSSLQLSKGLSLKPGSTIILFGDAGLSTPKEGYTSYSITKAVVEQITKALAVDLSPNTRVLCFRLGPTYARENHPDRKQYYSKLLINVNDPVEGLVRSLCFYIDESNICMTGSFINYDGGAYLKRR